MRRRNEALRGDEMKKALFLLVCLLNVCLALYGGIAKSRFKVAESEDEFDVLYFQSPEMQPIESKKNDDVAITQSFLISKNGTRGELRYSLFTDLGGDPESLRAQFVLWVMMCTNNIAGFEVPADAFSKFADSDVKNEFNGDFGCTAFIQNPTSEYGEGYAYMMIEFFCREGQGLVMRVFLFNDTEFIGMDSNGAISDSSPLFSNYHSFVFMDKDESGEYITD